MPYMAAQDDTDIFYSAWGTGYPIVFIHGGNVGSDLWERQVPWLTEAGYQCITYDQRGFSRSDCSRTDYEFDTLAGDLDRLVTHLQLSRFSVVAYSLGTGVVARYLSRYGSSKVDRAIFVSTILPCFLRTDDNPEGEDRATMYEAFRAAMINDRAQLMRDSLDAFLRPEAAEHPVSEDLRDRLVGLALESKLMPMLEFGRVSAETDFRQDMASITMPTLIVHGDTDAFAPARSTAERAHHLIRGSRYVSYRGASHGLPLTHDARLNREIADFVPRVT